MDMNLFNQYRDGDYDVVIEALMKDYKNLPLDERFLLVEMLTKANRTDEMVYYGIGLLQEMFMQRDQATYSRYATTLLTNHIFQTGLRVLREFNQNKDSYVCTKQLLNRDFIDKFNYHTTVIIPVIWPVAYGDMIVFNQYIKYFHRLGLITVVMAPLNRPDLKDLFTLNDGIDHLIDLTFEEDEKDRMKSIFLEDPETGLLNVTKQELEIYSVIRALPNTRVIRLRYLPFMFYEYSEEYRFRIWEDRASQFLRNGRELPKLIEQQQEHGNSIVVHFREGKYGDSEARDINPNYAQELINRLHTAYPQHEIVRLMDDKMTTLTGCTEVDITKTPVADQAAYIQKASLFLGSHSAPQHLAVSCSDTPIICLNYTAQETTDSMDENIPRLSYEPVGKQVRKIFYVDMFDAQDNKLIPTQNNPSRTRVANASLDDIMEAVKGVLK